MNKKQRPNLVFEEIQRIVGEFAVDEDGREKKSIIK